MNRDRELVGWIARLGAVEIAHVRERFGVGRAVAYELVARSIEAGLLERRALLRGEPSLIRATREGIALSGLGLPVARLRLGELDHWLSCADAAIWAERQWGADHVMSERELRFAETDPHRPIASAQLGPPTRYGPRLHRPDLVIATDAKPIAIEVELTAKSPYRLRRIIGAWQRARHVERVIYLCGSDAVHRGVSEAVRARGAGVRVKVDELERVLA